MEQITLTALVALFVSQSALLAAGFKVSASSLRDANGNNFVPRGLNNPQSRYDTEAYNALTVLANRRANCIRAVWNVANSSMRLDQILARCTALNMIPMVELRDAAGLDTAPWARNNAIQSHAPVSDSLHHSGGESVML